jgi:APA family basic amino acid/polyamine antiporter
MAETPGTGPARLADRLRRELGLFDATMVVAGSVIGVGIFTTTGLVAAAVPHPQLLLLAWLLGGLISLAGALTNAEMGASLPDAGGDYVYLREAFSPFVGFFAGWLTFLVVYCGTVGTLAAGFAEYAAVFVPALSPTRVWLRLGPFVLGPGQVSALAAVWVCTAVCWAGVREGARVQNALSLVKIGAIAVLCLVGPVFGSGDWSRLLDPGPGAPGPGPGGFGLVQATGIALVPILFTYLGWNAPVYVGSELRNPARTLPWSLLLGTLLCTAVYLLLNAVYLYALPAADMFTQAADGSRAGILRIAELAATSLFGAVGGRGISALVVVSILGCVNATVLVGARIAYAMALDRTVPVALAHVNSTRGTPDVALVVQASVSSLLVLTGSFDQILTYTTFAVITLMVLDGLALYRLRRRRDLPRPYECWGYPWVPGLYVAASFGLWANTLWQRPVESLLGLGIAATAIPAWWLGARTRRRAAPLSSAGDTTPQFPAAAGPPEARRRRSRSTKGSAGS